MKNNKKGFTLAELLVVVGIIAVLIAIAIPVFTGQLEKSREAVDAANIRSAYAEIMADALTGSLKETGYTVDLKQETKGFQANTYDWPDNLVITEADAQGVATLTYSADTGKVTVAFSGS